MHYQLHLWYRTVKHLELTHSKLHEGCIRDKTISTTLWRDLGHSQNVMLDYLSGLGPPEEQTFKVLTYKVVMLLALSLRQRRQTMHALDIRTMQLSLNKCTFVIKSLLKTSRRGKHLTSVEFKSYTLDRNLCRVAHISEYIKRTELLRGNQHKLFISVQKPYKEVSTDTISRWLKTTLALAGIDIAKFGAHSTRSALLQQPKPLVGSEGVM